jgi:hypothetical protein
MLTDAQSLREQGVTAYEKSLRVQHPKLIHPLGQHSRETGPEGRFALSA